MQDSYDDGVDPEKAPQGDHGDSGDGNEPPAQRIPDELPPVRIGEDKLTTPEHQENLRERTTDPGFDTDDTIDGLPVVNQNPDNDNDEPPSGDDPAWKMP